MGEVIHSAGAKMFYSSDAEAALKKLLSRPRPFSIIICSQRMPGMMGTEILERARVITPNTLRFIMTDEVNFDLVVHSVNQGDIHRFISENWDSSRLHRMITGALLEYERLRENEELLSLAQKQNLKLYRLNRSLARTVEKHKAVLGQLNQRIDLLESKAESMASGPPYHKADIISYIRNWVKSQGVPDQEQADQERFQLLSGACMGELDQLFREMAARNDFEIE